MNCAAGADDGECVAEGVGTLRAWAAEVVGGELRIEIWTPWSRRPRH